MEGVSRGWPLERHGFWPIIGGRQQAALWEVPLARPRRPPGPGGNVPALARGDALCSARRGCCLLALKLAVFRNGRAVGPGRQVLHPGGDPEAQPQQEHLADPAPQGV